MTWSWFIFIGGFVAGYITCGGVIFWLVNSEFKDGHHHG